MSCMECRALHAEDHIAMFSEVLARISNVMHCSENSQEVTDAQKANAKTFKEVRETWEKHECNHTLEAFQANVAEVEGRELPPPVVTNEPAKRKPGRPPKVAAAG